MLAWAGLNRNFYDLILKISNFGVGPENPESGSIFDRR
jgi:hypothetical protein